MYDFRVGQRNSNSTLLGYSDLSNSNSTKNKSKSIYVLKDTTSIFLTTLFPDVRSTTLVVTIMIPVTSSKLFAYGCISIPIDYAIASLIATTTYTFITKIETNVKWSCTVPFKISHGGCFY